MPEIAQTIQKKINDYVQKGWIQQDIADLNILDTYRGARFYILPKNT